MQVVPFGWVSPPDCQSLAWTSSNEIFPLAWEDLHQSVQNSVDSRGTLHWPVLEYWENHFFSSVSLAPLLPWRRRGRS